MCESGFDPHLTKIVKRKKEASEKSTIVILIYFKKSLRLIVKDGQRKEESEGLGGRGQQVRPFEVVDSNLCPTI